MSDLDAIKFLLDGSYRGAESKFKNQIKSLKQENETLKNRVADLEVKLAESERLIFTYQNVFRQKHETATEMCEFLQPYERKLKLSELEIDKLKQQLADKKQELSDRETKWAKWNKKDRIEFTIKELEKVKEFADIDFRKNCYINAVELDKFVDNQIKQLKEIK